MMDRETVENTHARRSAVRTIWGLTALTALLLVIAYYAITSMTDNGLDLAFLYYPVAITIISMYILSVVVTLKRSAARVLTPDVRALLVIAVFIACLAGACSSSAFLASWLLSVVAAFATYKIVAARSKRFGALALCAFFILFGLFAENFINSFPGLTPLGDAIFYCCLVPAVLSLLSLLEATKNNRLSYIGRKLSSPKLLIVIGVMLTSYCFYLLYVGSPIVQQLSAYLIVVEWAIICLVSYTVYRLAMRRISLISQDLVLGDWTMLVQRVGIRKNELDNVSALVSEFIDSGKKERLLAFISDAMSDGNADQEARRCVIKRLTDYRDLDKPGILRSWKAKDIEARNRKNRIRAVRGAFKAIVEIDNACESRLLPQNDTVHGWKDSTANPSI